tara:strand:- start:362 stop:955 length:594 start_codon:yes stop_codon:yes gene_type:complete
MLSGNAEEEELLHTLEKVTMVLNDDCTIRVDNNLPRYTNDKYTLYISKAASERYGEFQIKTQLEVLRMYVHDSLDALHNDNYKSFKKSIGLSRGIVQKLGIKSKKLGWHLQNAPPELLKSLDAHQQLAEDIGLLYKTKIIEAGLMPLMKRRKYNGRQSFIESGAEMSKKFMNHFHRTALDIAKDVDYEFPEEDTEEY